jgi:hypothetical protein
MNAILRAELSGWEDYRGEGLCGRKLALIWATVNAELWRVSVAHDMSG